VRGRESGWTRGWVPWLMKMIRRSGQARRKRKRGFSFMIRYWLVWP
jgi:hypothetical protein